MVFPILRLRLLAAVAAAAAAVTACGGDELPPTAVPGSGNATATASTVRCPVQSPGLTADSFTESVTLTTTADGLQYGDLAVGTGNPVAAGDTLNVQYTGWLTDGTVFDSSRSGGRTPFSFVIGATPPNVIKGWEEGLMTMRAGGKRRLVIPPALAYGAHATGCIPANATLVFDVQLTGATAASAPSAPSPSPT
ncbi:MAG: FKBP-type peptidyl-prolyl cis-trans isomerase [Candidatus Dormibacteraeota bacterium]|nr:FKBP-type peptidyl-prolyl cis-trans isomerase [Candidatus Dormibacteraeota bacterium]